MASNHVTVTINADSVSATRQGFGRGMFPSYAAGADKLYTEESAVVTDFGEGSPEALFAAAVFAQNPRPKDVLIARATLPPTKKLVVSVKAVRNSHKYQIGADGKGVTASTREFTSDANATNDEIVAGLVTALNGTVGKNFTATAVGSVGSQAIEVVANNPGDYFTLEILDRADLALEQTHDDPGIAIDLAAIKARDNSWYWIYTAWNSSAYAEAVADFADANGKAYVPDIVDTAAATETSTGSADALDDLATVGHQRTAGFWTHREYEMPGARWIGNLAPRQPGSWTGKFKTLNGASDPKLTPTERANLKARNANFVETERGVKIVSEGTTAAGPNVLRGFLDRVVNLDWVQDDAEASIFEVMAGAPKIPRTDKGMVALEGALEGSFKRGVANGIIAELAAEDNEGVPSPNVVVPPISEMDDLKPRGVRLSGSFKLADAVHEAAVTINVVL